MTLSWCLDLLPTGESEGAINQRIKVGNELTLLSAPGAHLLTGHLGQGQWIVGVEPGTIPFLKVVYLSYEAPLGLNHRGDKLALPPVKS